MRFTIHPFLVVSILANGKKSFYASHHHAETMRRAEREDPDGYMEKVNLEFIVKGAFGRDMCAVFPTRLLSLPERAGKTYNGPPHKPKLQHNALPKPETGTLATWWPEYVSSRMLKSRIPEEILNLTIRLGDTPETSDVELTDQPTVLEDVDSLNFMSTKLSQAMCILGLPNERLNFHYISPNDPFGLGLSTSPILIERHVDHIKPIDVVSTKPILGHFICFDENGNPINAKAVMDHGKTK